WRHGALQGNNNNNRKGGEYRENMMAVMKVTRQGMEYVTPMTGVAYTVAAGVDGTHNLHTSALVGSDGQYKPALLVQAGSHTGGNGASTIRAIGWDQATGFSNLGTFAGPNHDRHYYSNYLGNNPG